MSSMSGKKFLINYIQLTFELFMNLFSFRTSYLLFKWLMTPYLDLTTPKYFEIYPIALYFLNNKPGNALWMGNFKYF